MDLLELRVYLGLYCMDPSLYLLVQYSHHFGKFFENNFPESR